MKKILPMTLEVIYPFNYWLKKMPAEIQALINDKSRTQANEFEYLSDAVLFGVKWYLTENQAAMQDYYTLIRALEKTELKAQLAELLSNPKEL
jgi:hypothetical protein